MRLADIYKSIIIGLACLACTGLKAQQPTEQDLLLQPNELLRAGHSGNGNGANIEQQGTSNDVELLQIQESAEGNLARVIQSGQLNRAIITQTMGANQLLLTQNGSGNYYELYVEGTGNQLIAIQDGTGNSITQSLVASNHIRSEMVQTGNNNEIITILEGIQGKEFRIKQVGDGMKVTITQSSY